MTVSQKRAARKFVEYWTFQPVHSAFTYNNRSEVVFAAIGTNLYGYSYDTIGNRLWSAANLATNIYSANSLNQYTLVGRAAPSAPQTTFIYDADGNMTRDGTYIYSYDAENRLLSVTDRVLTNGAIRVLNAYDHRNRRIRKIVQRLHSTSAPPPAPPSGTDEWLTLETHTFVWEGNNIVLEKVEFTNGTTRTFEYFWGLDLSGTLQGAGGVDGLLAVSRNGQFYFPTFDNNGNVTKYIDESGNVVAAYEYDDFGRTISQSGPLADFFRHRYSTKYYDPETGLYYYGYRFYSPDWRIWFNRDPIEEHGGMNLYCFLNNSALRLVDLLGLVIIVTHVNNEPPPGGWLDPRDMGMTVAVFRVPQTRRFTYSNGKVRYRVSFEPTETRIDIYYRYKATLQTFKAEREHVDCNLPYDNALDIYKKEVEKIYDCPAAAEKLLLAADKKLIDAERKCKQCNKLLDRPGGPHGH